MKSAHVVIITPGRAGLYETTRELVAALRVSGVDARMFDPTKERNKLYPEGTEDRGAPFADLEWAKQADVLVNHSGLGPLDDEQKPIVHIAHGRPRSSFLMEARGGAPAYSYCYRKNSDPRFKSVVTFWPEHQDYLRVMWPNKPIEVVSAPVDLQAWSPLGPSDYEFGGKKGKFNIVCADAWRDDIDPFVAVNAFALWARKHPGAKLHIYGKSKAERAWPALLKRVQDDGAMGEIKGWVNNLADIYRSADLLATPHTINVRTIREAMACGCPVARTADLDEMPFTLALATKRAHVRDMAEKLFNPAKTADQFANLLEGAALTQNVAA